MAAARKPEEVAKVLSTMDIPKKSLEEVINLMRREFDRGLSADASVRDQSPVKMLPTYVRSMPDGAESGDFLALDLGGSNFRVLLVHIADGKAHMDPEIHPLNEALMTSDATTLFDHIANCLDTFVKKRPHIGDKALPLGFTFSFPVDQKSLTSGLLIRWTKGFSAEGVEGEDVVRLLKEALERKQNRSVNVVALVNDTTGTMISCGFDNRNVSAGLILGTGTNACYMESLDNVAKWDGDHNNPHQVIINTEWGAFGDNGAIDWLLTEYDQNIDRESINPKQQLFEKMMSGMYLGEIVRQVCIDLAHKRLLFTGNVSEKFQTKGSFLTMFVSNVESHESETIGRVLDDLQQQASDEDVEILKHVCTAVSKRAARLAAAGLATIVQKTNNYNGTIAIDGSLFKKHPKFKGYMQEAMRELLPDSNINLMLSEDGSGKGAALVAAVATRMANPSA